ncbi:MAG: VanZ family protein [Chloroflexi bacterium]|nr:VanZ family protein [Chloroflexota bacterium]
MAHDRRARSRRPSRDPCERRAVPDPGRSRPDRRGPRGLDRRDRGVVAEPCPLLDDRAGSRRHGRSWVDAPARPERVRLVPAGIYLPLLFPTLRRWVALLPFAVIGGASIELVQLAISTLLGFRYRSIDVDDAILNGVGLVLGWLVVRFTTRRPVATSH